MTSADAEDQQKAADERLLRAAKLDLTPTQIAERLRESVVGQDEAVRLVATHLATHLATNVSRAASGMPFLWTVPRLPNLLLVGPTGCGKSALMKAAASISSLPASVVDATQLTETGWVGETAGDWLKGILAQASGSTILAEQALLMIDEVDKRVAVPGPHRDISGSGAQDALLRLLDHAVVNVEIQDGPGSRRYIPIRTQSMLIVLAGAFSGMEEHVARRLRGKVGLGFSSKADPTTSLSAEELRARSAPQDLVSMGLKPEIVGRVGRIIVMHDLDRASMRRILTEVHDGPVRTLNSIASKLGFRLEFPPRLLDAIVDRALASGLGARAMHTYAALACERALLKVPDIVREQGRNVPWGCTVVQLRSDSLNNGYFAVRYELPHSHTPLDIPGKAPARGRRASASGG